MGRNSLTKSENNHLCSPKSLSVFPEDLRWSRGGVVRAKTILNISSGNSDMHMKTQHQLWTTRLQEFLSWTKKEVLSLFSTTNTSGGVSADVLEEAKHIVLRARGHASWDLSLRGLPNNLISCATLRPPRLTPLREAVICL